MKSILHLITYWILILLVITGCATMEPAKTLDTQTGKADIIIPHASKAEIADKITNTMLSSDFQLEMRDPDVNVLSFVKRPREQWLARYTYNIVNHPPEGVRVITSISLIHYPGRRDQVVTDLSRGSKEAESAYALLTRIRDNYSRQEPAKEPAKKGLGMTMKDYTITAVVQGGVAEKAGLQKGDVIVKIDGEPITGDEMKDAVRINGRPGATVKLLIKRDDQEIVVHLAR